MRQRRLRIDADDADAVRGRPDDRSDRGSVEVVTCRRRSGVRARRVGSAGELRVRDVDAGVDDRDRDARAGRRRRRVAPTDASHHSSLDERIDRARLDGAGAVRLDSADEAGARAAIATSRPGRARYRQTARARGRPSAAGTASPPGAPRRSEKRAARARRRGEQRRGSKSDDPPRCGRTSASAPISATARRTLRRASSRWPRSARVEVVAVSSFRETDPVGPVDRPAPVPQRRRRAGDVALGARAARRAARDRGGARADARGPPGGPRTLDLDLLLYGDERIDEPGLQVPHPRLHERRSCSSRSPSSAGSPGGRGYTERDEPPR